MSSDLREARWYLGSLNDGLFIVDAPPSPSGTDIPPDWGSGVGMVLNVVALTQEQAQAIVDAHNAALARRSGSVGTQHRPAGEQG